MGSGRQEHGDAIPMMRPLTHRQRFQTVLDGHVPDRTPVVTRLDLWYGSRQRRGTLPPEISGMTIHQVEEHLGMGRSARFRSFHREVREGVREGVSAEEGQTTYRLEVRGRRLRQVVRLDAEGALCGFAGQITEPYLKTRDDYLTMIDVWERTKIVADQAAASRFDRETGQAGFPILVFTLTPIHRIMLEYAGYERYYLHEADFPDVAAELARVMEAKYEAFWPELADCAMPLILHGGHWSSQMTPPAVFREKFLPYVSRFTDCMHAAGKKCALHADADLSGLLDLVAETGMDVAECFACSPLVPLRLQDARESWDGRIVIWGGFPSTLLEPSSTEREFEEYLATFVEEIADSRAMIVGVSDNVMPDASWDRLIALAQGVTEIRPAAR